MDTAQINGVEIAFEVRGEGEPVLLIHGAFVADAHRPLADRLTDYRTIRYHRRGYGDSAGTPPSDVATHAADARALLEHLGVTSAHVIGHSYGGTTALQLAAETPEAVASLVLLEPGLIAQIPSAAAVGDAMAPIVQPFAEGDTERATDMFLRFVMGPDYKQWLVDNVSAGAFAQSVGDADDAFGGDLTSLGTWAFGAEQAANIACPVLLVLGNASHATVMQALAELGSDVPDVDFFGEMIDVAQSWIPQAEVVRLDGLNHALQMQDPDVVARAVTSFLAEHRLTVTA
jgi:pimeloyl-ACP methyl ester carboxylesterase